MNRISNSLVAILALSILAQLASAQEGMISTVDAARAGLKVEWTSQVDISARGGKIVDIQLNVNENRATTFFALEYGNHRELISEFDIGPFGVPYGTDLSISEMDRRERESVERLLPTMKDSEIQEELGTDEEIVAKIRAEIVRRVDEAQEAAENRKERLVTLMKLQNRDVEVKLEKFTLPASSVYVVTNTGFVQGMDANTGMTRWSNSVGNRNYPTIGLGASNNHVAIVNGSSLYCLDAMTGRQLWSRKCRGSVGASPMVSDKFVFVPLVNGRLEAFEIEASGIGAKSYVSIGYPQSRPLVTETSVCWSTDRGYFTVAANDQVASPHYRLKTDSPIVSSGTASGGNLFVGATDGFAYGIKESNGSMLWQFSTGQRILQSPIPIGQYVYLITDEHQMFKLYGQSGIAAPGWSVPIENVTKFVGASKNKIYVQNKIGQIVALDQSNGARVSTVASQSTELVLPNYQSDRLYVGNGSGSVQCLRELASNVPYYHADEETTVAEAGGPKPAGMDEVKGGEQQGGDPFAAFGDEGGGDKKGDGGGDPFGNDPFGNDAKSGDKNEEKSEGKGSGDPFGGSNDPFKG
jgi:outer membrane protein assembly factor BamB